MQLLLRSYNKAFISPCVHKCLHVCVYNKINTPLGYVFISSFLFPSEIGIHNQILRRRSRTVKYNAKRFALDFGFKFYLCFLTKIMLLRESHLISLDLIFLTCINDSIGQHNFTLFFKFFDDWWKFSYYRDVDRKIYSKHGVDI